MSLSLVFTDKMSNEAYIQLLDSSKSTKRYLTIKIKGERSAIESITGLATRGQLDPVSQTHLRMAISMGFNVFHDNSVKLEKALEELQCFLESSDIKDDLKKEDVFQELDEASIKYQTEITKFHEDMTLMN